VAGDVVIVGSAVADNQRTNAPSGVVRAYDARTGAPRWAFDPAPPEVAPGGRSPEGFALSSPNVWAPMAVDEARDLVFLPTGNPTPDYATAWRRGLDALGSSVVALRASTGELVWHFQTVHHDLWDYDVPAQPTLVELAREGGRVPALVQPTKMGLLFTLHRETGAPLFAVEERPVPQAPDPGLVLAPTQPFPVRPPPLVRHALTPADAWGLVFFDERWCRRRLEALRYDGIYTPPSLRGSLMLPGNAGGSNWGGVAVDPERQLVVANTMDLGWVVTLLPPERYAAEKAANPGVEISPQEGTRFAMRREALLSPLGLPCSPPPWGTLAAVDLRDGEIRWQVPLGTVRDVAPLPVPWRLGVPNIGGPLVTAGGLVFIGAAVDDYLRAFDLETGEELWKGRLPAGGQATPMTYRAGGRQYVVIAAGGHGRAGTTPGDAIVAFALPE
jgi:quinoprotein glucose dehydrogenase